MHFMGTFLEAGPFPQKALSSLMQAVNGFAQRNGDGADEEMNGRPCIRSHVAHSVDGSINTQSRGIGIDAVFCCQKRWVDETAFFSLPFSSVTLLVATLPVPSGGTTFVTRVFLIRLTPVINEKLFRFGGKSRSESGRLVYGPMARTWRTSRRGH